MQILCNGKLEPSVAQIITLNRTLRLCVIEKSDYYNF